MSNSSLSEAAAILRAGRTFVVTGHTSPDGDCLGSICALGLALAGLGKEATLLSVDGVPEVYRFLPGSDRITQEVPEIGRFDVCITLDSDSPERLGPAQKALERCDRLLVIDHHVDGHWETGVRLIDISAASSGDLVYELFREAGVKITPEIAECLLTAIVTDTGSFRFANVNARTLRNAADLVEVGAAPGKISYQVYEARSFAATKLLGYALSNLSAADGKRITYTFVTQEQIAASGADESETDGVVNYVRSVRGTQVGIFFRETPEGNTRVSLRSTNGPDVSRIAKMFDGGGHRAAAGCTVDQPLDLAIDTVLEAVRKWMG